MLEQSLLRDQFLHLLEHQQQAVGEYESASGVLDAETRVHIEELCRDKKRHIELTERILEILE
jgi:hypothetical protein